MKSLPVVAAIPIELFDWETSNGEATAAQTQASYTAVTTKGETKDFSRLVWNDLVAKVIAAVDAVESGWDSTYGSPEDCYINEAYGELTARKFNAVTLNIEKIININWKWAFDDSITGFINRARVYGVAQRGGNADIVYGWYIVELARVVNLLIDILQDLADFSELGQKGTSKSIVHAPAIVAKSAPLDFAGTSRTETYVNLRPLRSAPLPAAVSSATDVHASAKAVMSKALSAESLSKTLVTASAGIRKVERVESHVYSGTNVHAVLKDAVYAARMRFQGSSKSNVMAEVSFYRGMELLTRSISESVAKAMPTVLQPLHINAHRLSRTSVHARIGLPISLPVDVSAKSRSAVRAGVFLGAPFPMISNKSSSASWAVAGMALPKVDLLRGLSWSRSRVHADAVSLEPMLMESVADSNTYGHAELRLPEPMILKGTEISKSEAYADTTLIQSVVIASSAASKAISNTSLAIASPTELSVEAFLRSASHTELVCMLPKSLVASVTSYSVTAAEVLRGMARRLTAAVISRSVVSAELTLYKPEPEDRWYDPIQTGSNLFISGAWYSWKEDDNLYIDNQIYYDPVQSGSNLMILSEDSVKGVIDDG